MSISKRAMAKRARMDVDRELVEKVIREQDDVQHHLTFVPRPSNDSKMMRVMREIYDRFDPWIRRKVNPMNETGENPTTVWAMQAEFFEELWNKYENPRAYSRPTVIKAKKLLGIRSLRIDNRWYWTFPKSAPDEAQEAIYRKTLEKIAKESSVHTLVYKRVHKDSVQWFIRYMKENNYEIARNIIYEEKEYGWQTVKRIKAFLGVVTIYRNFNGVRKVFWIYPAKEVQNWLLDQIPAATDPPIRRDDILTRAQVEKGWSEELIMMAKEAAGGIRITTGGTHSHPIFYWSLM